MTTPPPILLTNEVLAKFDFGDLFNHMIKISKNSQLPTCKELQSMFKTLCIQKKSLNNLTNLMTTPPPILLTNKVLAKFDFGDLLNHMKF